MLENGAYSLMVNDGSLARDIGFDTAEEEVEDDNEDAKKATFPGAIGECPAISVVPRMPPTPW